MINNRGAGGGREGNRILVHSLTVSFPSLLGGVELNILLFGFKS